MRRFNHLKAINRLQVICGVVVLLTIGGFAAFAPIIARYPYDLPHLEHVFSSPSSKFFLGTDNLGRDIFSRLTWGSRESLSVAVGVEAIALPLGIFLGFWCAYKSGILVHLIERLADLFYAFPTVMLAMLVAALWGPGKLSIIIAVSIGVWPVFFRLSRSLVMGIKHALFVDAAIVAGAREWHIFYRHILPNIISMIIPKVIINVGAVIMAEAILSFIGLGIQPPVPSWGNMIRDGLPYLRTFPGLVIIASSALAITTVGLTLLGDGISDWLNPNQN